MSRRLPRSTAGAHGFAQARSAWRWSCAVSAALAGVALLGARGHAAEPVAEKVFLEETGPADAGAASEPEPEREAGAPAAARRHWLTVTLGQDFLLHGSEEGACSAGGSYFCFGPDGLYTGPIYEAVGDDVKGGFGPATRRILLGYDMLLGNNLTLGGRLGYAFGGAPAFEGGAAFLPLHAEARSAYFFGSAPFERKGLRLYAALGFGVAQVDGRVFVEFFPTEQNYSNGEMGRLEAWRKTGNAFAAVAFGGVYPLSEGGGPLVELKLSRMLGAGGTVVALQLGYALGL